jgi:hypothetical protein
MVECDQNELRINTSSNAARQRRYRERNAQRNERNADDRNERNGRNALTVTSPVTPVTVLCPAQSKITIEFDEQGNAILRQSGWFEDDDAVIRIERDNIPEFIDRLTDALGIPTLGGPA